MLLRAVCIVHIYGRRICLKEVTIFTILNHQCPYLLKFVDRPIVLDVEVMTDLIIKLRIRRMVFTKPLVDITRKIRTFNYDKCVYSCSSFSFILMITQIPYSRILRYPCTINVPRRWSMIHHEYFNSDRDLHNSLLLPK